MKEYALLEKLKNIGLDDFKFCSISFEAISVDWWHNGRDFQFFLMIRENENGHYELSITFYDVFDDDIPGEDVFKMKFSEETLHDLVYVNKKLCKSLLTNENFKFSDKKNLRITDDYAVAVKLLDKILYLVRGREIINKSDSKPLPEDPIYAEVKQVLRGELIVNSLKQKLIDWISNRFQIQVLHIMYDTIDDGELYRIMVIVKTRDEFESMYHSSGINYNSEYQQEIADAYEKIYGENSVMHSGLYRRLFVAYSNFHDLHGWSNNKRMTSEEAKEVKEEFSDLSIWQILRYSGAIFICPFTQKQVEEVAPKRKEELRKRLYEIEKKYDEFDELTEENFSINFISKQTIDEDYNGEFMNLFR